MRLESALFTSKSGILAHGQAISVIGDNVANSNTVGFKSARAEFADIFTEGREGRASIPGPLSGNGVLLNEVRPIFVAGVLEQTERQFDMSIDGRGFFIAGNSESPVYTRAGNFEVSPAGILTTSDGLPILGFRPNENATLTELNLYDIDVQGRPTGEVRIFGNLNAGLPPVGEVAELPTFNAINGAASFVLEQSVYDSLGESRSLMLAFFKTAPNTWTVRPFMDGSDVGGEANTPVQVGEAVTLRFGPNGALLPDSQSVLNVQAQYAGGAAPGEFAVNLAGMRQFAAASTVSTITNDGRPLGRTDGYEVDPDGTIRARLDNGESVVIGLIPIATFRNEDGLARAGATTFQTTPAAGEVTVQTAGTGTAGKVRNFSLERSTVDISREFVDLTLFQRGYQANSQTLNATSQLLRETIQLMR